MSKQYQFVKRHIMIGSTRTTVSVDRLFMSAIDHIASVKGQALTLY